MDKIYKMPPLPTDVTWYRTVGTWRGDKIPKGLFQKHNTAQGVWGRITVLQGAMEYYDYATDSSIILHQNQQGVIPTQRWHHIKIPAGVPPEQVQIKLDFYR